MTDALSFSQPFFCMQLPIQSQPKIHSPTSSIFHLPIPPLLVYKIILTIPSNTPFLCISGFFTFLFLRTAIPAIYSKVFLQPQPFNQFRLHQEISDHESLVRTDTVLNDTDLIFSLLPESIDTNNRAYNCQIL